MWVPIVVKGIRRARLKSALAASRQTIDVRPGSADKAIEQWGPPNSAPSGGPLYPGAGGAPTRPDCRSARQAASSAPLGSCRRWGLCRLAQAWAALICSLACRPHVSCRRGVTGDAPRNLHHHGAAEPFRHVCVCISPQWNPRSIQVTCSTTSKPASRRVRRSSRLARSQIDATIIPPCPRTGTLTLNHGGMSLAM